MLSDMKIKKFEWEKWDKKHGTSRMLTKNKAPGE
jgi:hypothetical protein